MAHVVVVNQDGEIIEVQNYNPALRPASIVSAAEAIAVRLGCVAPTMPGCHVITDASNNEWFKMTSSDFVPQIGMVEAGMGRWGFDK